MTTPTPLVTIPGCTAEHVLGKSNAQLGSGDLTLVASGATSRTPALTLTVGKAAFPLFESTSFGTVAGDERIYVFHPELGDDVKGYVRITLPDGVREAGSEFQSLQTQFEKLLIDHGLLKPGEGPNERSVTIPSASVTHVLGDTTVELARGDLTLTTVNTSSEKPDADPQAVLALTVGEATFPLHRTTLFGTLAENQHTYAFKPEISGTGSDTSKGYVKVFLPEEVASDPNLSSLQEQFEQILIDYGLLKAGVEAVGDELGRSVREDAASAATTIRQAKDEFLAENPPVAEPATFSSTTHKAADGAASATRTVYGAAQTVSTAVSSAAASAGAWISSQLGPASPSTTESLNTLANAYDAAARGVAAGTADVKDAASEAVGDVVQNEFGPEARDVGGRVTESVGNVGGAVGQVAEIGSGAAIAVAGVKGAVVEENRMQEEMGVFKIQEREESGEWKEVPM